MKIFDTKDIREIDEYTIKNEPVSSAGLMERAASGCTRWITEEIHPELPVFFFTGPGNNGGDGWAIARMLADRGYRNLQLFHLHITDTLSADSVVNRDRLLTQGIVPVHMLRSKDDFPALEKKTVIIDALFGSGLSRSLEGRSAELVRHLNQSGCRIISIDIPSGLFGEDNTTNHTDTIITACDTLTFEFPKRSFFYSENEKYTGKWHIIPIGLHHDIIRNKPASFFFTTREDIAGRIKKRRVFSHKGIQGHALLIAGSYGMLGAAILSARACMRTGTGLVTTHIPKEGYPIVQAAVPESIFSIDQNDQILSAIPGLEKYSAVGAGPGIGTNEATVQAIRTLLKICRKPMVLDADALNILANDPEMTGLLPENTILTPHPGEFDRLTGKSPDGFSRNRKQIDFSIKYRLIVVLKGAYSSVTLPDGRCYFNSTGNPGMATAGSGDVLTGMILSLLAQGYQPEEAALLGTYLHGLAGDLAVSGKAGRALIASDIIDNIGDALNKITEL